MREKKLNTWRSLCSCQNIEFTIRMITRYYCAARCSVLNIIIIIIMRFFKLKQFRYTSIVKRMCVRCANGKQCVSKNYDKKIYLCVYNYFILYALGLILIMFIRCAS